MVASKFTKQLEEFAVKVGERGDQVVGEIVTTIMSKIDKRSPVGNPELWVFNRGTSENPDYVNFLAYNDLDGYVGGRFRANWQLGIGTKVEGVLGRVDDSDATLNANIGKIPDSAAGEIYILSNNLPYAQVLENGWSTQAPKGMIGLTVVEFQDIVVDAVAGLPE